MCDSLTDDVSSGSKAFDQFILTHKAQLEASSVPSIYWFNLFTKLTNQVFDAGQTFSILKVELEDEEDEDLGENDTIQVAQGQEGKSDVTSTEEAYTWQVAVSTEKGIRKDDPRHIYLIDHAWTYQVGQARAQLEAVPGLAQRMAGLMDIDSDNCDKDQLVHRVLQDMWRFNQTYQLNNVSQEDDVGLEPMWYILDEFGSRVQHSSDDEPTVRMVPFYYSDQQITFTLMWPITYMQCDDEVTRDYAEGIQDLLLRRSKLLPWIPGDLTDVDWQHIIYEDNYFQKYSKGETMCPSDQPSLTLPTDRKIRVYSDINQVCVYLRHDRFEIVDSPDKADIWWLKDHFKDYRSLCEMKPPKLINQFPCEMLLTVKDPLAVVARRASTTDERILSGPSLLDTGQPKWLPCTYNLQLELPQFVSYYQHRQSRDLDNHWICKPWNMARGLDMHITSNLNYIVRLAESGPKVVCKYIEDPVLFHREELGGNVKFDIRYIVMLGSTHPLKLYAYRVFWLRFANKTYSLDHFDDYEKHFTVMNYQSGVQLKQVHYDEFIPMFNSQYPKYNWTQVEEDIFSMFKELFSAAVSEPMPKGLPHCPHSRSIYAIDLMLKWHTNTNGEKIMQPMLCEVNFCPDCERACKYHPNFYNDVFSTLFLDSTDDRPVTLL